MTATSHRIPPNGGLTLSESVAKLIRLLRGKHILGCFALSLALLAAPTALAATGNPPTPLDPLAAVNAAVSTVSASTGLAPLQAADAVPATEVEQSFLAAVNTARASYGVAPLQLDATLQRAARAHSADMLRHNFFAHGAFGGRMLAFHVRGPFEGENLAWGTGRYGRPGMVVRAWLASPEHRANLLRPGYARIGLGVSRGSFLGARGATVVTADFAGH
jgi:uncharacterized protein YkwD